MPEYGRELQEAIRQLRAAMAIDDLDLPVAIDWLLLQAAPCPFPGDEEQDNRAVCEAALFMRPYQASALTRAALLLRLRPSERRRRGFHGLALVAALRSVLLDWDASRVPIGMAVGVFVGLAIGPPSTQNRLDAFATVGMTRGVESVVEMTSAMKRLMNAQKPGRGTFMMCVAVTPDTEETAKAVARDLSGVTLQHLMAGPMVDSGFDARELALCEALAVVHCIVPSAGLRPHVVRLSSEALNVRQLRALDVAQAVAASCDCVTEAWPLAEGEPFIVVYGDCKPRIAATCIRGLNMVRTLFYK